MKVKKAFRIIFMGTPQFAVPALKAIHESEFSVVAVITATDKYGGRGGKKLLQSAIKKYAVKNNIPVLQPKNLKSSDFIKELKSYRADLQLVVAFRMLPEVVWNMPAYGTINLHASLLPKYRGAAPIHWAIINGEKETGLTTFKLKHAIDTGDLIDQVSLPISHSDTMGSLADKMSQKGATLLLSTTEKIFKGNQDMKPQDPGGELPLAPKIFFDDAQINFRRPTLPVYNFIRGMNPFPGAWTKIDQKVVKIFECETIDTIEPRKPNTIRLIGSKLYIHTNDGAIQVKTIKVEGKRKMKTEEWLRGYDIKDLHITES